MTKVEAHGDAINRQAVLNKLKRICDTYCDDDKKRGMCRECYLYDAIDIVENMPKEDK